MADTIRVGDHGRVVRRPVRRGWWNYRPTDRPGTPRVRLECLDCGVQVQETPAQAERSLRRYPCRGAG